MTKTPNYHQRIETLLFEHTALHLSDMDINSETELTDRFPPKLYTPAEVVHHIVEKYDLVYS